MSVLFPYLIEYEYDDQYSGGVAHNSCQELSEPGAQGLFHLLKENPRVRYCRYWKFGEEGNRAEYWRK